MATSVGVERTSQDESVSRTIISAVAELTGSEPGDLEPLYSVVDPDALNALFDSRIGDDSSPIHLSFQYCDCEVEVSSRGTVRVSATDGGITKRWR